jgi:hypothetical protein
MPHARSHPKLAGENLPKPSELSLRALAFLGPRLRCHCYCLYWRRVIRAQKYL